MNKPTEPNVGDCWLDTEETQEILTWTGEKWIVMSSYEDKEQLFGDNDTVLAGDGELTLIPGGVETLRLSSFNDTGLTDPGPNNMCIFNDGKTIVTIDLKTGDIEFDEDYNPTEAAKIFWESISNYRYSEQGSYDALQELRTILGVKENESICSVARDLVSKTHDLVSKTHKNHCQWYTWNHYYSWHESDCTCKVEMMDFTTPSSEELAQGKGSKVETLPGGDFLLGLDDIRYFEEKLARTMKQNLPTDKIEKQLEVLENAIINCPYIPECFESAQNKKRFDEAMKVIE